MNKVKMGEVTIYRDQFLSVARDMLSLLRAGRGIELVQDGESCKAIAHGPTEKISPEAQEEIDLIIHMIEQVEKMEKGEAAFS